VHHTQLGGLALAAVQLVQAGSQRNHARLQLRLQQRSSKQRPHKVALAGHIEKCGEQLPGCAAVLAAAALAACDVVGQDPPSQHLQQQQHSRTPVHAVSPVNLQ
jgi:hypothetical protein